MYAVIETGGKQLKVAPGETVHVDSIEAEIGTSVELGRVLAVITDGQVALDSTAKVTGTVVGHDRDPKVLVFKFKRKKQYRKTIGHRQNYTAVKIDAIA